MTDGSLPTESPDHARHETPAARWDRNYVELLQELRVAQTGVQILFAFLLTLPFSVGFSTITGGERNVYVMTLVSAAFAAALLIAPVSHHRMAFREGRKPQIVRTANILAMTGLAALLLAIIGSVYLVLEVVAGITTAAVITAALAGIYVFLWYVLPMILKARDAAEDARSESAAEDARSESVV
jgi:hypothetical protein